MKDKGFFWKVVNLNLGEALEEMARLVQEHLKEKEQQKQKKKYKSFFYTYDQIKFKSGDPDLCQKIDDAAYGRD